MATGLDGSRRALRGLAAGALCLAALVGAQGGCPTPAHAARIDLAASALGPNAVADFSGPGLLSFDPAFSVATPMVLVVEVEEGDVGHPLVFDAAVDNLTGELFGSFFLAIDGAGIAAPGDVTPVFGGVALVVFSDSMIHIRFDPEEPAGFDLGAPFGGGDDWEIDLFGLSAGGTFQLTLAPTPVPEPGSSSLLLLGIAGLALGRRVSP